MDSLTQPATFHPAERLEAQGDRPDMSVQDRADSLVMVLPEQDRTVHESTVTVQTLADRLSAKVAPGPRVVVRVRPERCIQCIVITRAGKRGRTGDDAALVSGHSESLTRCLRRIDPAPLRLPTCTPLHPSRASRSPTPLLGLVVPNSTAGVLDAPSAAVGTLVDGAHVTVVATVAHRPAVLAF